MWRGVLLVRPGVWLCLLGSALALVAFFVPYFGPPPGSLWDIMLLYWTGPEEELARLIWLSVPLGVFLLLLMGMMGLAFLAFWPRPLKWAVPRWYRRCTILVLVYYMVITLVSFLVYWLAGLLGGDFLQISIGGWLLPLGLLLALIGSILVPARQPSERVPVHLMRQVFQRSPGRLIMIVVVVLLFACSLLVAFQPQGEFSLLQSSIVLSGISMVSPSEGWAVGDYTDQQGHRQGRIYHYKAGVWKRDTLPPGSGVFTRVWMLSPQEGWAVGFLDLQERSEGQIYHYQDGVWQQYMLVPETSGLFGIQLLSPNEGWAVGGEGTILHYHQGSWTSILSPTSQDLFNILMLSPQEGWAVGFDTILHYQDGLWQEATDPFPRDALESISMISPTQGWIVGLRGATLQYVNGQWVQVPSDTSAARFGALSGVAMVSASEAWAVGDGAIFHYQDGVWKTAVKLTNISLGAIAMVSAEESWAVGSTDAPGQTGIIMHYSQGKWEQVKVPDLTS